MGKKVKYMRDWGEVAPALLISQQKTPSFTKLEPIVEEGSHEGFEVAQKGSLFLLPLLFSAFLCLLLYKDVVF